MERKQYKKKRVNGKMCFYHRWYYEQYYQIKIPEGYVIHHKDGNTLNNDINNLEMLKWGDHCILHHDEGLNRKDNKEYYKERKQIWEDYYTNNRETILSKRKLFREQNKEHIKIQQHNKYIRRKEKKLAEKLQDKLSIDKL